MHTYVYISSHIYTRRILGMEQQTDFLCNFAEQCSPYYTKNWLNGSAMARHGLILSEDGAIPCTNLLDTLLILHGPIFQ